MTSVYVVTEDVVGERATLVYASESSALKHVWEFAETYGGGADRGATSWRYGDVSVEAEEVEVRP